MPSHPCSMTSKTQAGTNLRRKQTRWSLNHPEINKGKHLCTVLEQKLRRIQIKDLLRKRKEVLRGHASYVLLTKAQCSTEARASLWLSGRGKAPDLTALSRKHTPCCYCSRGLKVKQKWHRHQARFFVTRLMIPLVVIERILKLIVTINIHYILLCARDSAKNISSWSHCHRVDVIGLI